MIQNTLDKLAVPLSSYRPLDHLQTLKLLVKKLKSKEYNIQRHLVSVYFLTLVNVKGYSALVHLQTLKLLVGKSNKYNINVHQVFVDYRKAFDSIETWALLLTTSKARIDSRYSQLIQKKTIVVKIKEQYRQSC